jgi:peroxiredoxin Q/BCP
MPQLHIGDAAPLFSLPDQNGTAHALKDLRGSWILLYFYPKDDTPGCTTEACNFRDNIHLLTDKKIAVFGISKDTVRSHFKFADKFKLSFPLLSDPSTETIKAYGAWGPKKFMGREFLGTQRKTFLISPDGEIMKEYYGMDLKTHAQEILKDIDPLL